MYTCVYVHTYLGLYHAVHVWVWVLEVPVVAFPKSLCPSVKSVQNKVGSYSREFILAKYAQVGFNIEAESPDGLMQVAAQL
jgi:hypothetical protein